MRKNKESSIKGKEAHRISALLCSFLLWNYLISFLLREENWRPRRGLESKESFRGVNHPLVVRVFNPTSQEGPRGHRQFPDISLICVLFLFLLLINPELGGNWALKENRGNQNRPSQAQVKILQRLLAPWNRSLHAFTCTLSHACCYFVIATVPGRQVRNQDDHWLQAKFLQLIPLAELGVGTESIPDCIVPEGPSSRQGSVQWQERSIHGFLNWPFMCLGPKVVTRQRNPPWD